MVNRVRLVRQIFAIAAGVLGLTASALALVGGAPPAEQTVARHVVLLLAAQDGKREACTGTAIARDLVLTAAHCVGLGATITVVAHTQGRDGKRIRVAQAQTHPSFTLDTGPTAPSADLALLKLAEPLPSPFAPAPLGRRPVILIGERFVVAGYGVSGGGGEYGILRAATLMAIRAPSEQQFLLADPATRGETTGLGVCSGDSGGPVFDPTSEPFALIAVVSWASTARHLPGCGGLTGATPVTPFRDWIVETAKKMGSPLAP
jgi:secreted trypsin-like serine protease